MALTTTLGYTFVDGELVTATKLGQLGTPTVPDGQNAVFAAGSFSGVTTFSKGNGGILTGAANAAIYLPTDESTIQGAGATTQVRMGGNLTLGGNGSILFNTNGALRASIDATGNFAISNFTVAGVVSNNSSGVLASSTDLSRLLITDTGTTRLTADFPVATSTTQVAVSGIGAALVAGSTYTFEAYLYVSTDASHGGWKAAMFHDATLTFTNYIETVQSWFFSGTPSAVLGTQTTSLAAIGGAGFSVPTSVAGTGLIIITGTISVNVGGLIGIQFAQQTAAGTSTALRGSWLRVRKVS